MDEFIISAATEIRNYGKTQRAEELHDRAVRAYPASPVAMHLQIRARRGRTPIYAGANLSKYDVLSLRDYLSAVLREHFGCED